MDLIASHAPTSPVPSSSLLSKQPFLFHQSLPIRLPTKRFRKRKQLRLRASSSGAGDGENGSDQFSWKNFLGSIRQGSGQFVSNFTESLREDTGLDLSKASEAASRAKAALERFWVQGLPEFIEWNKWERWKEIKHLEPRRVGALILYTFIGVVLLNRSYAALTYGRTLRRQRELTDAYMEALIPEPSPANIRKLKKGMWRKTMPKGLKMKKFVEGPGGTFIEDTSFVGENAWDDDSESSQQEAIKIIEHSTNLSLEQKEELKKSLELTGPGAVDAGENSTQSNWRERLAKWREILREEKETELMDHLSAKYVVDFDMDEVEKSLCEEVDRRSSSLDGSRASWVAKRWWLYRPKLPYKYFLDKLDSNEVEAIIFSENLKKAYVTMKEGFPVEYIVNIPLDPYLFEKVSSSGAEVDLLQKRQIEYFLRLVIAFAPGLLIMYFISQTFRIMYQATRRHLFKRQGQFFYWIDSENFILPLGKSAQSEPMYKEVVLGGDAWDLLDEIMIYLKNPMDYYERGVPFVRGILLSGPPGTGKTLFARTLSKESGLPFIFASGADFADRKKKSGAAMINRLFITARRNAPSFVFIDEIDAIAGRNARLDKRRSSTFNALLSQLDGDKEKTGVDRYSLSNAVIFICATNRPEELDNDFIQPGRIDRKLTVSLPGPKQRVGIFHVHSRGKKLAADVDFGKIVFRTIGYSGADIKNLVNESAIMSVRNGHETITQKDIIEVLEKQLLEGMGVLITEEEQQQCEQSISLDTRRLLAVHEAGHILLAHIFPRFDWHAFSQLLPVDQETAISVFYPREDMDPGYMTLGYMKMQMVVAHGGRCAERIVFGDDITDGGKDDLEKITKIAREIAISPANPRLGLTPFVKQIRHGWVDQPYSTQQELIKYKWDDPCYVPVEMTVEISEMFTREIENYIEETEEMAMDGLLKNRHILDALTNVLLEKSRITGLEAEERIKDLALVMFEDLVAPVQINLDEDEPLSLNNRVSFQPLDVYSAPLHRC
ncbi:ATP-dependent zinc metalloprotease FtsH [Rhynchospora pubera]|uniref:ATP-dependent zinc metalloprotease FtsH n=1 Tax=Rhynchospora pubera TaxID=906938 RepID=A0AAV8CKH3_9POAL|nr:ATP-dependent zinc metalloprotease FtsH [Rhynchospora pubera]